MQYERVLRIFISHRRSKPGELHAPVLFRRCVTTEKKRNDDYAARKRINVYLRCVSQCSQCTFFIFLSGRSRQLSTSFYDFKFFSPSSTSETMNRQTREEKRYFHYFTGKLWTFVAYSATETELDHTRAPDNSHEKKIYLLWNKNLSSGNSRAQYDEDESEKRKKKKNLKTFFLRIRWPISSAYWWTAHNETAIIICFEQKY